MRRWRILGMMLALGAFWACGSVSTVPPDSRGGSGRGARPSIPQPSGPSRSSAGESDALRVVGIARSLLSTPYRYAGTDPEGFDCSGLTAYVFAKIGKQLPRTALSQASAGRWIAPDELSSGDLVFFGEDRANPYHVGLVVSRPGEPLTMIHASSSRGVIQTDVLSNSYWLPRLRFGRRVLGD